MGLVVFDLITADMSTIFLTVDDTLIPRTGRKIVETLQHVSPEDLFTLPLPSNIHKLNPHLTMLFELTT